MNIAQILRPRPAEPTSAELREQHRQVALRIIEGRAEAHALEHRIERLRMRRAELRDIDAAHPDLEATGNDITAAERELADLVAQQRYRETRATELEIRVRAAEAREAPALQAERASRHTELRRALPGKLRETLAEVEQLQSLQVAMQATHHQYGATADVLPLYGVLDRLTEVLTGAAAELEQYDGAAAAMAQELGESGTAHLRRAHWVEG